MEPFLCPHCWAIFLASLAGILATIPFLKAWATKWRQKLLDKHSKTCDDDCQQTHDEHKHEHSHREEKC